MGLHPITLALAEQEHEDQPEVFSTLSHSNERVLIADRGSYFHFPGGQGSGAHFQMCISHLDVLL